MSEYLQTPEEIEEKGSKGIQASISAIVARLHDKEQNSAIDPNNPYSQTYNIMLLCGSISKTMEPKIRKNMAKLSDPESEVRSKAFKDSRFMITIYDIAVEELCNAASKVNYLEVVDFYRSQGESTQQAESMATKLEEEMNREVSLLRDTPAPQKPYLDEAVHQIHCQNCILRIKCPEKRKVQEEGAKFSLRSSYHYTLTAPFEASNGLFMDLREKF